jgi:TolB-like protein
VPCTKLPTSPVCARLGCPKNDRNPTPCRNLGGRCRWLLGADEGGTLQALKASRAELIDPTIAAHHGRLVKTTGDGLLVEFGSVVDALRCATEMQAGMAERKAAVPAEKRIEFRIGINVGDIVVEDGDIFGDGVNVAARLEGLAEPGGICVSARVQEDATGKLDLVFEDLGEQALKNIVRPVRAYRVLTGPVPTTVQETPAALALPDKPSIAVLPFANMSGDPEQEYFADGMVEEIITALSRIRWLFVIARNSSFSYKGQAIDVKRVGRELGVRYLASRVKALHSVGRIFRRQIDAGAKVDLDLISYCADRYRVSLIAAILRWLTYTSRRAVLVVSRDDFILWSRSSDAALKTGAFFRTSRAPVEIPAASLAATQDQLADGRTGVLHGPGVWFDEEVREMTIFSEQYDFTVSLLLLEDRDRYIQLEPDPEEDTYDRFIRQQ